MANPGQRKRIGPISGITQTSADSWSVTVGIPTGTSWNMETNSEPTTPDLRPDDLRAGRARSKTRDRF